MTKKEFAKQLFQLVKNSIEEEKLEVEIIDDVEIFLETLEPRGLYLYHQITIKKKKWKLTK